MKKFYSLLLLTAVTFAAQAQDTHYTQFYNSPLTLNPALTGLTGGTYRVGLIYRNQWFTGVNNGFFKSPYQTPSVSFDMPIKVFKNDNVGVGAYILNDQAGAGSLSTFQFVASASYIQSLGKNHNHQLSAGFQVGYTQTRIKAGGLEFGNQFNNNEFNGSIASGVNLAPNVGYVNLNLGLLYYGKFTDKISLYLGGAFSNITTPKYNLTTDQAKKDLPFRWNVAGGMDFKLGKKFHLLPSGLFMRQATADQLNTGLALGVDVKQDASVTFGFYNRVNDLTNKNKQADALIAYFGFDVKGFKVGTSYDFTMSKFKAAGPGTGGLEISLIYVGRPKNTDLRNIMFCPRF
jgi:type IX secretion system PorP/SprF family membrane protein